MSCTRVVWYNEALPVSDVFTHGIPRLLIKTQEPVRTRLTSLFVPFLFKSHTYVVFALLYYRIRQVQRFTFFIFLNFIANIAMTRVCVTVSE